MTGAPRVALGVAGALGAETIARIGAAAESAGFAGLWVNDTPDGDALAALAAVAEVTTRITLATGVVPVDRRPAGEIAAAAASLALPHDRLVIGIGSGAARKGALARVDAAVSLLRADHGGAGVGAVVVGALGPRMRRLGAERADGVLLNWVPPREVARQAEDLRDIAADSRVAVYVRTAVDAAARPRLDAETARYAAVPHYAANLARMGVAAAATTFPDAERLRDGIEAYTDAADEVVLRAVTAEDSIDAYLRFIDRAVDCLPGEGRHDA